ncbi:MAG TPA: divergent polysaccharide deacetylase family protein [Candidatus Elarobacter sp.]|nr:divergent polysaccharide deacetylase family protein [Candidatus Elarobacter sp.]
MKRRRRSGLSVPSVIALLVALGVLAGAVALIVRGDTTPRPARVAHHLRPIPTARPATVAETASNGPASAVPRALATAIPPAPPNAEPGAASPPPAGGARLALIVDDCGQWPDTEHGFIAMPIALTMSVLPHVRFGAEISRDARAAGKDVILHLPMEPMSGIDPGPGRITTKMDDAAIAAQVRDDIASVPLADGVNNHEGSRATSDDRVMRDVAAVLAADHLFFIDSLTAGTSVAARDAHAAGVPTATRDVFLDNVADVAATEAQLRRAAAVAKANGSAIAIGHPRPTTLAAARALVPQLQREGITFVLARDLVR